MSTRLELMNESGEDIINPYTLKPGETVHISVRNDMGVPPLTGDISITDGKKDDITTFSYVKSMSKKEILLAVFAVSQGSVELHIGSTPETKILKISNDATSVNMDEETPVFPVLP